MNVTLLWTKCPLTYSAFEEAKFFCAKMFCDHAGATVQKSGGQYIVLYWDK